MHIHIKPYNNNNKLYDVLDHQPNVNMFQMIFSQFGNVLKKSWNKSWNILELKLGLDLS